MTAASPAVRLGLFAALLTLVFGVAFGIGSAGPPVGDRAPMEVDHGAHG